MAKTAAIATRPFGLEVRGADDPTVWRELERNIRALGNPDAAARVLAKERLAPRSVVGLVIVPGRGQSPVDFGDRYALVGLADLKDRVVESESPQDLWQTIKAHERRRSVDVVPDSFTVGEWTVESDGVSRTQLIAALPTR